MFNAIKRYFNPLENPRNTLTPEIIIQSISSGRAGISNGVGANVDGALSSSTVFACVDIVANAISTLTPKIYSDDDDGCIEAEDHRVADLLKFPNGFMTGCTLMHKIISEILLQGNSYVYIERDGANRPISLMPLQVGKVTVKIDAGEKIYQYGDATIPSADILHFYHISGDGLIGVSVLRYAAGAVTFSQNVETYGNNLFARGATHSGIFTSAGKMSPEQQAQFKQELAAYEGAGNAGGSMLLSGITYTANSMGADDAQFLETRKFSVKDIARFFGVPIHLLNEPGEASYASAEQAAIDFFRYSIRPRLVKIEQEINTKLLGGTYECRFDTSDLVRGDTATMVNFNNVGIQGGWLTANEARANFNLPPIDGGDTLKTPMNLGNPGGDPAATAEAPQTPPNDDNNGGNNGSV